MSQLIHFFHHDHQIGLVLLAAAICVVAALSTVTLLRLSRDSDAPERWRWLATAALISGFGIWATHFVAMLGYDPGLPMGYAVGPTILSLLIAILGNGLAYAAALLSPTLRNRGLAAIMIGASIGAMHYLGMSAVQMAGRFVVNGPLVAVSIVSASAIALPALSMALDRRDIRSALAASLLIVLATVTLHFTGMAAVTVERLHGQVASNLLLSNSAMAAVIAGTAFAVITIAITAAIISLRARAILQENEHQFKTLIQGINDCALYMLTADGHVASWNNGAERLKGYRVDEAIGLPMSAFYNQQQRDAGIPADDLESARTHGTLHREGWRYRKDGTRFWAHISLEAVHDTRGGLRGYAKITRDMTQFKADQDRLAILANNLDAALNNMQQGLCLFDPDGRLLLSNPRVFDLFGLSASACPAGTAFADMYRMALEQRANAPVSQQELDEVLGRHRAIIAKPDGGTLTVTFTAECTLSIAHRPMDNGGWVTTFDDITERRQAEQRIQHMAMHDGLTGLPNRMRYLQRLEEQISQAQQSQTKIAVIGIDLDRFKEINDVHGHAVGDMVLVALSARMIAALRPHECAARFGGDEFAAYKSYDNADELDEFVHRLEQCFKAPMEMEGMFISPSASLGIAIYPDDGADQEQVLNNADLAMYRAKETVDRHICYYEQGMDEASRARRLLANDLREALRRDEFSLAYQVQRSVQNGEITGYEALLRWYHPHQGWISPEKFIPIAEESGVILALGEWVLRAACAEAANWPKPWRVAVNLSPIQLMHIDLVAIVISALSDANLPAHRLELEITESAIIADKLRALHILRQIKALGVTIAIDDFGTGYSSLDTLNSFPFDKIKIDKSFLLDSGNSRQARAIIRAVLALGKSLEVPVLAEGLETEEQLLLLQSEGCDQAQGYLWGHPASNQQFDAHALTIHEPA